MHYYKMVRTTAAARANNKRQYKERILLGLCRSCGVDSDERKPAPGQRLCPICLKRKLDYYYRNREKCLSANQKYARKLRDEVFFAYGGPVCVCCNEVRKEFLTIDHANGDGAAHRKEVGKATHQLTLWLKRNNFPPGFRILCMNCNFSFGMHGYCPHQKEKQMEKYGVDEGVDQEALEKAASEGCPNCGRKDLTKHGSLVLCPTCGSAPFEQPRTERSPK